MHIFFCGKTAALLKILFAWSYLLSARINISIQVKSINNNEHYAKKKELLQALK